MNEALQQPLPFTVLKRMFRSIILGSCQYCNSTYRLRYWSSSTITDVPPMPNLVGKVLTIFYIEIPNHLSFYSSNSAYHSWYWNFLHNLAFFFLLILSCNSTYRLRYWNSGTTRSKPDNSDWLQQYSPFTVLKPTFLTTCEVLVDCIGCNSTYRLRYWNHIFGNWSITVPNTVATVLTVYGMRRRV